jgi:hypothetical protein
MLSANEAGANMIWVMENVMEKVETYAGKR